MSSSNLNEQSKQWYEPELSKTMPMSSTQRATADISTGVPTQNFNNSDPLTVEMIKPSENPNKVSSSKCCILI